MIALLAAFGAFIEIAEIPTIILLLVWVYRLRRNHEAYKQEIKQILWESGAVIPVMSTESRSKVLVTNKEQYDKTL